VRNVELCREVGQPFLILLEDGLWEEDWESWQAQQRALGITEPVSEAESQNLDLLVRSGRVTDRLVVIGDDLFVSQQPLVARGIREGAATGLVLKLNQNGLLTDALAAMAEAAASGLITVIAHRSGETIDTTIADLAADTRALAIKAGAPRQRPGTPDHDDVRRLKYLWLAALEGRPIQNLVGVLYHVLEQQGTLIVRRAYDGLLTQGLSRLSAQEVREVIDAADRETPIALDFPDLSLYQRFVPQVDREGAALHAFSRAAARLAAGPVGQEKGQTRDAEAHQVFVADLGAAIAGRGSDRMMSILGYGTGWARTVDLREASEIYGLPMQEISAFLVGLRDDLDRPLFREDVLTDHLAEPLRPVPPRQPHVRRGVRFLA
jgi:hypothetical protein